MFSHGWFEPFEITAEGDVVFGTILADGRYAVFKQDELLATFGAGVETAGHTVPNVWHVDANEHGDIVFGAQFDEDGLGLFTPSELIVQIGDTIDGREIVDLSFDPQINERGDFVFRASFADGSEGIILAAVPEPSTSIISIAALAVICVLRTRARDRS